MKELLRSNNLVKLSWAQSMLQQSGIESVWLDRHTSVMEGSISAIEQRLVVAEDDYEAAKRCLQRAERELEH